MINTIDQLAAGKSVVIPNPLVAGCNLAINPFKDKEGHWNLSCYEFNGPSGYPDSHYTIYIGCDEKERKEKITEVFNTQLTHPCKKYPPRR